MKVFYLFSFAMFRLLITLFLAPAKERRAVFCIVLRFIFYDPCLFGGNRTLFHLHLLLWCGVFFSSLCADECFICLQSAMRMYAGLA